MDFSLLMKACITLPGRVPCQDFCLRSMKHVRVKCRRWSFGNFSKKFNLSLEEALQ